MKADKLTSGDFNGRSKQFYLYYDIHKMPHWPEDSQQLSSMQAILTVREKRETDHLHILIEQPTSAVRMFDQTPNVTTDLADCIKDLNYTTIENAEIRCVALAAELLFKTETNPHEVFPKLAFNSAQKNCIVNEISIIDLLNEYACYSKEIQEKSFFVSYNLKQIIDKELVGLKQSYDRLKKGISFLKLQDNDHLLTLAKRMEAQERSTFLNLITSLFDHLFELYLFKHMIELDTNKIVLIAGFLHIQVIKQMLEAAGAEDVPLRKGYSIFNWLRRVNSYLSDKRQIEPLGYWNLDIF